MKIFGGPEHRPHQKVTSGRFELERDGHVAFLEYAFDGKVLELVHTEVPRQLRGMGIASSLAQSAFEWAREHKVKVDVLCPHAAKYVKNHPEYADLVLR